jgi:hypothetical protein
MPGGGLVNRYGTPAVGPGAEGYPLPLSEIALWKMSQRWLMRQNGRQCRSWLAFQLLSKMTETGD